MDGKVIAMLVICLSMAGIVGYIYYFYEKPKISNTEITNVSIGAEYRDKKVITSYIIESQEGIIEGNTSDNYELIKLRSNQTITITNINLKNQSYYEDKQTIEIKEENQRIDLFLDLPRPINFTKKEMDKWVNLTLRSENAKEINFCLVWSFNYFFVHALNYTQIEKPIGYEDYDRCYNGNFSLINTNQDILVTYELYANPEPRDYLNITLWDKANNTKTIKLK